MTFEEEIEWVKDIFKEQQEVCPMFIFYSEDSVYTMPFMGNDFDGEEKMYFVKTAKIIMLAFDCHAYTFMSEMWMRQLSKDDVDLDNIDPIVSDKPDKIEGVFILRKSRDIEKIHFFNIVRGEGEAYLKESDMGKGFEGGEGTFSNLFPPRQVENSISMEHRKGMRAFLMSTGCIQKIEKKTA